ncbi:LuxR C-terminal-related transcriptional regulator [Gillisia sp. M10.2A]|uniref:LuxR C-terminal-related transcriptional regulator n=1 Tax=Gillisia lutea TaxID=2909668 RepID=A0ABS9EID9_9FLAO|nr:LuxR C-terminal-related transcriptional regulator [Gillisia lutea]MCF4102627.1 LuxR C-terminal-related transcriptional regulator [Gillisia lutea]
MFNFKVKGMNLDKKQLLVISKCSDFIGFLSERLSLKFDIAIAPSLHTGYMNAMHLLPDVILIDEISLEIKDLKNLSNFKSTHFLNKSWLIMYTTASKKVQQDSLLKVVDEVVYSTSSVSKLCARIVDHAGTAFSFSNYWKEAFLGLFNLLSNPVVLLEKETIVSMNDAFRETFKINKQEEGKLIDFVNCENKTKVKASLLNFARGKHMKAVAKTAFCLKDDKIRNATISLSKLDKMTDGQFIMMINFSDDEHILKEEIGTNSTLMENCFKENSKLAEFHFTRREKEIIQLLCKGYKTKEISEALFISTKTIEKHRANIIKRTHSETIIESIIYAINHQLVDVSYA